MTATRLPDGFAVQVDRRVRVLGEGAALLGGSPTRLLRLAPAAQDLLDHGRLEVRDGISAQLARTLLDATVAHPRPVGGPGHRDVTVVIPVRDNLSGVRRLLGALRGLRVVVVDDGSLAPIASSDLTAVAGSVEVLRHDVSRGPAAARNTGLAACTTDFVAFLDSDVVPQRGWLEGLLGHFCDPTVALVAPRVVGLPIGHGLVARYEAVRSSLDLGEREAPVQPYGAVSYVPSAAIVCRRSALVDIGGFDEAMHSGEDVDLCWRLVADGKRLRYEPIALVGHEHRTSVREWLGRKAFYGASAAPLSARHPANTAPLIVSGPAILMWAIVAIGSRWGRLAALLAAWITGRRIYRAMRAPETQPGDLAFVVGRGMGAAALQTTSALCRHYWPVAAILAAFFRRWRLLLLAAAVVDGVVDWFRHRNGIPELAEPIGLIPHVVMKRLDDAAYGAGLWQGALREGNLNALKPQFRA